MAPWRARDAANRALLERVDSLAEAARESERALFHYRELFEAAPDPTFLTDAFGIILQVNAAARALIGQETPRIVGKPLAVFVHIEDRRLLRSAMNGASRGDMTVQTCLRFAPRRRPVSLASVRAVAVPEETGILWFASLDEPADR